MIPARILVPLDGSDLSARILPQVRRILHRKDAEVMLLCVLPAAVAGESAMMRQMLTDTAQRYLDRASGKLTEEGARVHHQVREGKAAEEILKFAAEYRPSLVAMSTHARKGVDRWILGSVAEEVVRQSSHPLLLVNPAKLGAKRKPAEVRIRRVLVPLDGSEAAAEILPLAGDFARLYEAEIILCYVEELYYAALAESPVVVLPPSPAEIEKMLEPFRNRLKGIPTRVRTLVGSAAGCIVEAAKAEQADLIAMTTHGRSGISRLAFGSVAEQVLRESPCPLLLKRVSAGVPAKPKPAGVS